MKNKILIDLNKVYQTQNPSFFVKNLEKKKIQKVINSRKNLLLNLKLPQNVFTNAELLDLGCGSGQTSIVYDSMNAKCTLVEYDKQSIKNAKRLFKKFGKNRFRFVNKDLFKFKSKKKFDFVVSNGVSHHTHDPHKNIDIACKFLKKKGFLILGVCTKEGWFQRNLQRAILFNISKNWEEIEINAKKLFKDLLKRSKKFGLRSDEETIYDTYINPKINCVTINEIEKIFSKNKMSMYSTLNYDKQINNFVDPYYSQQNFTKISKKKKISFNLARLHEFNLTLDKEKNLDTKFSVFLNKLDKKLTKVTSQFNDLSHKKKTNLMSKNLNNLKKVLTNKQKITLFDDKKILNFIQEVESVLKILRLKNDQKIKLKYLEIFFKKNKYLFKDYCGVGMNYFVGLKN